MVNLDNNNNTIIENVEYLDMMDPKNSWYFDAERFDVNFPLVRSYNGGAPDLFRRLFSAWCEYWDGVFAYYSSIPGMACICFVVDTPDIGDDSTEYYHINDVFRRRIADHFNYEFLFQSKQALPDGKKITYFLVGLEHKGNLTDINERFYLKNSHYSFGLFDRTDLCPHTQLIISRDWGLLKRYFFFMIRNHQYKNSEFVYVLEKRKDGQY